MHTVIPSYCKDYAFFFSNYFRDVYKAEQKEKEKRHRERLRSIEIQRDKLHKAACYKKSSIQMKNHSAV
ncbi:hypothetical protein DICVIV_02481 [Dictyocaulus viviparus]|uniref:Uncharacterized protein n=1 Tax=Dictyocaulus viviparus TaxID=29172 RepID=A0A0D8Y599_DICVI|nr:hypothetical protein DICVIV_02481 [Dictyocaulus viviparus]